MILRDSPELRRSLAKEALAVLTGGRVSITDDVGIGVGDGHRWLRGDRPLDRVVDRDARVRGERMYLSVVNVFQHGRLVVGVGDQKRAGFRVGRRRIGHRHP